ncbi:cytochrome P450 [Amylostereum chailletii]|nr:cytochrome P450 [Amylostereum chailletii]
MPPILATSEIWTFAASLLLLGLAYGILFAVRLYIRRASSPLRTLAGPPALGWLSGSIPNGVDEYGATRLHEQWIQKYGRVFRYYASFGTAKMMVADPKAVAYIISHGATFEKWGPHRARLITVIGDGLASVEGSIHKRQRKVLNPAFGPVQLRKFTVTFLQKSIQLRDIWLSKASQTPRKDGKTQLDAFNWLNKVTLDMIGLTGFNYSFNALELPDGQKDELYEAISTAGSAESGNPLFRTLQLVFPPARLIPTAYTRRAKRGLDVVHRIGNRLVSEKKAAVLNETRGKQSIAKDDIEGHDLLSLLIKANMAADMPESMRLSDSEVRDQVPTFLTAGHETTSTTVAWTLTQALLFTLLRAFEIELAISPDDIIRRTMVVGRPWVEGISTGPQMPILIRPVQKA